MIKSLCCVCADVWHCNILCNKRRIEILHMKRAEALIAFEQATENCKYCSLCCLSCPDFLDENSALSIAERNLEAIEKEIRG